MWAAAQQVWALFRGNHPFFYCCFNREVYLLLPCLQGLSTPKIVGTVAYLISPISLRSTSARVITSIMWLPQKCAPRLRLACRKSRYDLRIFPFSHRYTRNSVVGTTSRHMANRTLHLFHIQLRIQRTHVQIGRSTPLNLMGVTNWTYTANFPPLINFPTVAAHSCLYSNLGNFARCNGQSNVNIQAALVLFHLVLNLPDSPLCISLRSTNTSWPLPCVLNVRLPDQTFLMLFQQCFLFEPS